MIINAHSDQLDSYRYRLLEEIWRDACSGPFEWELLPALAENYDPLHRGAYRNTATGDTITCQGNADGSHSFTFEQGLTSSRDVQDTGEGIK